MVQEMILLSTFFIVVTTTDQPKTPQLPSNPPNLNPPSSIQEEELKSPITLFTFSQPISDYKGHTGRTKTPPEFLIYTEHKKVLFSTSDQKKGGEMGREGKKNLVEQHWIKDK
jgi:hypothetical protein